MAFAIALVLLVVGTLLFHFLSPWWFTPIASNWTTMDQTVNITFWVTGIVFVAVNLFMAYAVIRYNWRWTPGDPAAAPGQPARLSPARLPGVPDGGRRAVRLRAQRASRHGPRRHRRDPACDPRHLEFGS